VIEIPSKQPLLFQSGSGRRTAISSGPRCRRYRHL